MSTAENCEGEGSGIGAVKRKYTKTRNKTGSKGKGKDNPRSANENTTVSPSIAVQPSSTGPSNINPATLYNTPTVEPTNTPSHLNGISPIIPTTLFSDLTPLISTSNISTSTPLVSSLSESHNPHPTQQSSTCEVPGPRSSQFQPHSSPYKLRNKPFIPLSVTKGIQKKQKQVPGNVAGAETVSTVESNLTKNTGEGS